MNILLILKVIGAVATIATGVYALIKPRAIKDFTGLDADNPRGVTEVRSIFGALFIGLGLAPFILPAPEVFQTLGIMYLAIAVVRAVSMFMDKSVVQSNWISLAVEVVFGVILVL